LATSIRNYRIICRCTHCSSSLPYHHHSIYIRMEFCHN